MSPLELLSDAVVRDALRRAYVESDVGGPDPCEHGGFILRHADGNLRVERLPSGEADALEFPICAMGVYNGMKIEGTFHTHPNTGLEWRQEPSQADIDFSLNYPETSGPIQFVISQEKVYCVDNEGSVAILGTTQDLILLGAKA